MIFEYFKESENGTKTKILYDNESKITKEFLSDGEIIQRDPNEHDKYIEYCEIELPQILQQKEQDRQQEEFLETQKQELISTPFDIPEITGSTVQEVTTSAQVAIENLAQQMNDKIQIITGQ